MVFKCKMCGGDIVQISGTNTGKCEYCKSIMTLPNSDDEKIVNLYNRANFLRMGNDFDKAKEVYENILTIDNKQTEAHWGILLCKYGVEYVDDPKTGKKIPTCHRTINTSILSENDYKIIKKEAYGDAIELYEEEANKIADIQKKILDISSKESPYDIFICYKETDDNGERTNDSVIAQDIYDKLVENGYRVFFSRITLEDKLGVEYEPYIYSALTSSRVMLVVGTKEEYFNATWVKNEWSRFIEMMKTDKNKTLIPVFSKIDAYKITEEFAMYQAQSMDKVGAMQDLIRGVNKLMDNSKKTNKDEFTYEMYEKFKKMKEEEEREIQESLAANKQVEKVYETSSKRYKIVAFIISAFQAFLIFYIVGGGTYFIMGYYANYSFSSHANSGVAHSLVVIMCIITLFAFFISIISKKGNQVSKYLYGVNIIFSLIIYIHYSLLNYIISPLFSVFVGTNIVLLLLWPKWRLAEKVIYVTSEEKKNVLEQNKKVKLEFDEKTRYPKYLIAIMIVFVLIFVGGVVYNSTITLQSQSNERNTAVKQVKIKNNYINLRKNPGVNEQIIGKVYKDELFTILETQTGSKKGVWYKITTSYGLTGYIYSGDDHEYVTILE